MQTLTLQHLHVSLREPQSGEEQYFNLEKDPCELHNLIKKDQYADEIVVCRNWIINELTGREEGYTDGQQLLVGRSPLHVLSHIL